MESNCQKQRSVLAPKAVGVGRGAELPFELLKTVSNYEGSVG
jgi:hypothetical protein